jgi:hypothetical protein
METKTREPRHVKREMPYLLIRPSHVSGKTVFFIENPPPYKMKNADPRSFTSMVGNPGMSENLYLDLLYSNKFPIFPQNFT